MGAISNEHASIGHKRNRLTNPLDFTGKFLKTTQGFLQSPTKKNLEYQSKKRKVFVKKTDQREVRSPTYDDVTELKFPMVSPSTTVRESDQQRSPRKQQNNKNISDV